MIRHLAASAVALVLAVSCVAAEPASAQTAAQLAVQDATRTTRYLCETADGSGNLTGCLAVGAATSAAQSTGNGTLSAILTALGNPMQTGGSVSISNTPTVNIGSIGGGATASAQGTATASFSPSPRLRAPLPTLRASPPTQRPPQRPRC